jgi:hypothetical protein
MSERLLEIPVRFQPASHIESPRTGEPVTFGVPLPKAASRPHDTWKLSGAGGDAPVQARAMDLWSDGSVRWLLVDALVTPGDSEAAFTLRRGNGAVTSSPFTVQAAGGRTEVNTGAVTVVFERGGTFPFAGASLDLSDQGGGKHDIRIQSAQVRITGPVRTIVDVQGVVSGPGPLSELHVRASVDLFAGSGVAKVAVTIRNPRAASHPGGFWDLGDPGSLYLREASIRIQATPGEVRCSIAQGDALAGAAAPFEVYQDSSGGENWQSPNHINRERRVPTTFRGYRVRHGNAEKIGLRAAPVVVTGNGADQIAVTMESFWQNFPKAISVGQDGTVSLSLFPSQFSDVHEIQGGEQKTHVCYIVRGPDTITTLPLAWTRSPLIAAVDPAWVLASGAVPWLAPDDADHRSLIWTAIEGDNTFERKREVVDQYGWRNFGDVYGDHEGIRHPGPSPLVSHYNNQYDPVAGFLYQFFRSGDTRWWTMARELARHVIDIDIYHTTQDKWAFNHGLFWHTYHYGDADTATHRTYPKAGQGETHGGGPSPDQNYTTGLLLYHFLTGDESARATVTESAQYVIDADDGAKTVFRWLSRERTGLISASGSYTYHGPGRGPGNSLNALVDGHRLTGDVRFLQKAEELIRRVVHPAEDIDRHQLDDPENKWFYLMFLQALGKYLAYKLDVGQIDEMYAYAKASLLHYARWMAAHEYPYLDKPERLTFPTETWAAHEMRKSDVFYLAALHSGGQERERFVERGRFFFRNSIETLQSKPTRAMARPVIVLLSSGLLHPWFQQNGSVALPDAAQRQFPPQQRFVPQREIATRRAKVLLAGAAAAGVLAAAAIAYLLISSS